MNDGNAMSLYERIAGAALETGLPAGFSLSPSEGEGVRWADGAQDGVLLYHMGPGRPGQEVISQMSLALQAASKGEMELAAELFGSLGKSTRALRMLELMPRFILEHADTLSASNLFWFARRTLVTSKDAESVKYALIILQLLNTGGDEGIMEAIRTIGLCDEFTLYAILVMLRWEKGNQEIWELGKKVHGWGRIHAVEYLEPQTPQIREWLLFEGIHNEILPQYSALTVWMKTEVGEKLLAGERFSPEQFSALGEIMLALEQEGPVVGCSGIEEWEDVRFHYLLEAKRQECQVRNRDVLEAIRDAWSTQEGVSAEITALLEELLS